MRKYQPTRESQIPQSSVKVQHKTLPAVAYLYNDKHRGRPCAICFYGKADKPAMHTIYRNDECRAQAIAEWFAIREASAKSMQERANQRKAFVHTFKVGDILSNSWGYDQTNVEFFQVTKLIGKSMVEIREIAQDSEESGWMTGSCVPVVGTFRENCEPMRRKVTECGVDIYQHGTFGYATKYERKEVAPGVFVGQPQRWSSYA